MNSLPAGTALAAKDNSPTSDSAGISASSSKVKTETKDRDGSTVANKGVQDSLQVLGLVSFANTQTTILCLKEHGFCPRLTLTGFEMASTLSHE